MLFAVAILWGSYVFIGVGRCRHALRADQCLPGDDVCRRRDLFSKTSAHDLGDVRWA